MFLNVHPLVQLIVDLIVIFWLAKTSLAIGFMASTYLVKKVEPKGKVLTLVLLSPAISILWILTYLFIRPENGNFSTLVFVCISSYQTGKLIALQTLLPSRLGKISTLTSLAVTTALILLITTIMEGVEIPSTTKIIDFTFFSSMGAIFALLAYTVLIYTNKYKEITEPKAYVFFIVTALVVIITESVVIFLIPYKIGVSILNTLYLIMNPVVATLVVYTFLLATRENNIYFKLITCLNFVLWLSLCFLQVSAINLY